MKVGFIGAPKAGKTRAANALALQLNQNGDAWNWKVVDRYVEKLSKRTGRPYDIKADFPDNIAVMCERWNAEAEALRKYENTITCGTIYETLAYTLAIEYPDPKSEAQMLAQVEYLNVNYKFLGAMEDTTADYDLLFYLPYKVKQPTWHGVVDQHLPNVLEKEFRRAYILTGTTKEKVNVALEKIKEVRDLQAATSKVAQAD